MLLAGLCVFLYPVVSNYLQEKNHTEAISVYNDTVEKKTEAELSAEWEKAKVYNENLAGDPVHDPFVPGSGYTLPDNYNSILNLNNDGMMGYIEIPSISVNLPIYHSTTEEVLEKGVGHIESTSLPIGGSGTHCVLTGHTGLPSAELFTRLSELEKGDVFYISVLDKTLAYKVCEINVVLPNDGQIGCLQGQRFDYACYLHALRCKQPQIACYGGANRVYSRAGKIRSQEDRNAFRRQISLLYHRHLHSFTAFAVTFDNLFDLQKEKTKERRKKGRLK